ncbi:hypothetical protein [Caballeronia sp. M23-90]
MDEQKNHSTPPPHTEPRSPISQASTPRPPASRPRSRKLLWIVVLVLVLIGLFAVQYEAVALSGFFVRPSFQWLGESVGSEKVS